MRTVMLFGDDVWGVIGLYAAYAPLRRVCRRLCALLRDQHLKVQVSPSNVLDVVAHLGEVVDMVRSLVLTAPRCAQLSIREAHSALFAQLLLCKNLQALSLALRLQAADASWAKSFATLQNLSSLEFIELHWSDNNVGPMGVGYLARLLQGHFIKGLYLDIARNAITTSGVEQWVSVIPSCSLSSLCLTLSENRLGDCGAQLLRACLNCHSLRILKLSLDDCSIPTLFPATQGQRLQSQLTTLSVDLARNPLTDVDILAQHLSSQTPALRNLTLALCGTQLSTPAAQTLLAHIDDLLHLECLAGSPMDLCRRKLTLTLGSGTHHIGDASASQLGRFRDFPLLRHLEIRLTPCSIGDRGVIALASPVQSPCLKALRIKLSASMALTEVGDTANMFQVGPEKKISVGFF